MIRHPNLTPEKINNLKARTHLFGPQPLRYTLFFISKVIKLRNPIQSRRKGKYKSTNTFKMAYYNQQVMNPDQGYGRVAM